MKTAHLTQMTWASDFQINQNELIQTGWDSKTDRKFEKTWYIAEIELLKDFRKTDVYETGTVVKWV